jgi:DNA-binding FadR family transcriptional regulator
MFARVHAPIARMQPINMQMAPILMSLYEDHRGILEGLRHKDPNRVEKAFQSHKRIRR